MHLRSIDPTPVRASPTPMGQRMPSLLNDAWEWLYRVEEARKAADLLTDPHAKEAMIELGIFCERKARAAIARASALHLSAAELPAHSDRRYGSLNQTRSLRVYRVRLGKVQWTSRQIGELRTGGAGEQQYRIQPRLHRRLSEHWTQPIAIR
jgi:hypothetical protein